MRINTTGEVIITDTTNVPGTIYSTEVASTIEIRSGYVTISNINIRTEADHVITVAAYQNDATCVLDNVTVNGEVHAINGVNNTATIEIISGTFTPATNIEDFVASTSTISVTDNTATVTSRDTSGHSAPTP